MIFFRKYILTTTICVLLIFLSFYLILAIYIGKHVKTNTKTKSDVIIVLGAKTYRGESYNPCLVSRVEHAVDLYKKENAPKILVSGENDKEDNVNEAETMKKIAVERGVSPDDIILERSATSTYENLLYSKKILEARDLNSAIIITEPFHIARASLIAEKLNLNYTMSPAAMSPCWLRGGYFTRYFLKEPFAIVLYKIQNKL